MRILSITELKQNSLRLQEALKKDILISKWNKPFVVVMDYEKYIEINNSNTEWSYWSDIKLDNFAKQKLKEQIKTASLNVRRDNNEIMNDLNN